MNLAELHRVLRAADPAAVLVSPRIVERVIQETRPHPGLLWVVPHRKSIVVERSLLFRYVEQEDLNLESDQLLPSTVILLAQPSVENLAVAEAGPLLLSYWRRLFHANVHLVLENRIEQGLLPLDEIQHRLHQIGGAEFEEIRRVLVQDEYLPPRMDDRTVYVEFIAVYLELKYFAANLLPVYFPGLLDRGLVDRLVLQDLDPETLYKRTRLVGAPDPVVRTDSGSFEAHEYYWRLMRNAERAAELGNVVKAAILHTRAYRVAPPLLAGTTRAAAESDLQTLTTRLQAALLMSDGEAAELFQDLRQLLEKADQGRRPVEAAFLYDLQKVCLDQEQEIYVLDLVAWAMSAGKKPIKRPLPSQRLVRITRHLRSAVQRLTLARLTDADRVQLTNLLQTMLHQTEERLRARFRPALVAAFEDVGLKPRNPPEQTAFSKMVEELLDRIADYGYLTFSDLRDSISRNQLKMPDLSDPQEFIRGDPLIRLDRRLSTLLDGVYRHGEVYMRWLERLTALNFGTHLGRLLTYYVTLPFGGAFLLIEAFKIIWEHSHGPELSALWLWVAFFALAGFGLAFVHSLTFRQRLVDVGRTVYRPLRIAFIEFPAWLARIPWLRRLLASWPMQLLYWFVLKPGLLCLGLWLFLPWWVWRFLILTQPLQQLLAAFILANLFLNSRLGQALTETLTQAVINLYNLIGTGLFLGLLQIIIRLFKRVTDTIEYVLVSVEEWLRFRGGDSTFAQFIRGVANTLWFPIAYVARFYMIVLVEPMINPLKLPISTIAGKFIYPLLAVSGGAAIEPTTLDPVNILISSFIGITIFLSPNLFGFLTWEMKENWSLYRAHRPQGIGPVSIGPHGETMRSLLQPGFHSGTLPNLYRKLRRAEKDAPRSGNWRTVRALRHAIEEVRECVSRFVTRELIVLLHQSPSWQAHPLSVANVHVASNRIRVQLRHKGFAASAATRLPPSLCLEFESRQCWLVARIAEPGWLPQLPPEQLWSFLASLRCLYKLAGVDLVDEQVRSLLPLAGRIYDINRAGLVIWLDPRKTRFVAYNLRDAEEQVIPHDAEGEPQVDWPAVDTPRLLFSRFPLTWEQWVQNWQQDQAGAGQTRLLGSEFGLALVGRPALVHGNGTGSASESILGEER